MSRYLARRLRPSVRWAAPVLAVSLLTAGCANGNAAPPTDSLATSSSSATTSVAPGSIAATSPRTWSVAYLTAPLPTRAFRRLGRPVVYLTFDDGPSPTGTLAMLAVLQRHHAKATFFVIGETAAAYPNLVREEIAAGESVGGHTWTHPHLRTLSRAAVTAQLADTRDLIRSLGAPARCFRPPYGETDSTVSSVARSLHVHQYLWTTESKDWTGAPANVDLTKALAGLQPGAIIVFHDWVPQTQQVVDQFLTIAARRGYIAAALPC